MPATGLFVVQTATVPPTVDVRAVHETVADIAGQAAYRRSATDTLAARLWQLLVDTFDQILQTLTGTPTSRRITLAVLGVVVALLLLRLLLNERHARALARRRSPVARQQLGNAWDAAQRLAADGNFTEAAHALCAAVLQDFARRGEVRLHPSKTTGDYARELRRRSSPTHGPFQRFRRRYDALVYGEDALTAVDYAALLHDASPLLGVRHAA